LNQQPKAVIQKMYLENFLADNDISIDTMIVDVMQKSCQKMTPQGALILPEN
jgi:hypothetical protein